MYKIWQIFDPFQALIGLFAALFVLALVIHTLLLSTDRYNWIEGVGKVAAPVAEQMMPPTGGPAQ